MILSVSRRTDIPRFYFDWFLNRLKDGYVFVRNPMNPAQVSRIALNENTLDFIVFWSKNPEPMLAHLKDLEPYPYYIQFTINPYDEDIESNLPPKKKLIDTFKKLSDTIGADKMVWRYSPLLLNEKYTPDFHIQAFEKLAHELKGATYRCHLSFLDMYAKIEYNMKKLGVREGTLKEQQTLATAFKKTAVDNGMTIGACGNVDLKQTGLNPSVCIDGALIEKLTGMQLNLKKDKNQRDTCYCTSSIDIGTYNTCLNGCAYCYANHSTKSIRKKVATFNPLSPILCDFIKPTDKIIERAVKSNFIRQKNLFG